MDLEKGKGKKKTATILEQEETKIVVPRDYSIYVTKFDETYPAELKKQKVSEDEFKHTIQRINELFKDAETLSWTTFCEGCVGCLTLFSIFLCYENQYKKIVRELDIFIESENERVYRKKGLELLNPISNGLLELEIKILFESLDGEDNRNS